MNPRLAIAGLTGLTMGLLALSGYLAYLLRQSQAEAVTAAEPPPMSMSSTERVPRLRPAALQQFISRDRRAPAPPDWRSIESTNYTAYIANLRQLGCPEETIQDIILADINKLYGRRRAAVDRPEERWVYWRSDSEEDDLPAEEREKLAAALREYQQQVREIEQERRGLVRSLLGASERELHREEEIGNRMTSPQFQFLPEEKRRQMVELLFRYETLQEDAHLAAGTISEAGESVRRIAEERDAALAKLLSPEELEAYQLRVSPIANELRERLRGFGASEEEFRQLFALERDLTATLDELVDGSDPQAGDKSDAAAIEHDARIEELLGPQRYAEYRRSQDGDYQMLYELALEHEVPPRVASQVYDMRRTVKEQTDRIRDDPLLTATQKRTALEAVRMETEGAIVDVLGEPLLEDYRQQGGGWLSEFTDTNQFEEAPPVPPASGEEPPDAQQAQAGAEKAAP